MRSDSKRAEHLTAFTGRSSPLPLFTSRPGAKGASLLSPTEAAGRPPRGQPVTALSGTHPPTKDAPSAPGKAGPGPCWALGRHRPSFSDSRPRALLPRHTPQLESSSSPLLKSTTSVHASPRGRGGAAVQAHHSFRHSAPRARLLEGLQCCPFLGNPHTLQTIFILFSKIQY